MNFRTWVLAAIIEGLICLLVLLIPSSESAAVVFLRYSAQRLVLILASFGLLAAFLFIDHQIRRQSPFFEKAHSAFLNILKVERNLRLTFLLLLSGALTCLYLLISWSTIDPLYQGILLKISPIWVWASLIGVQSAWLLISWGCARNRETQEELIPVEPALDFIKQIGLEIFTLIVLIGTQYAFIPHRFWGWRPWVLQYSPLIIFGLIALARGLHWGYQKIVGHKTIIFITTGLLLAGFLALGLAFANAAERHSLEINSELLADQSAYVKHTQKVSESGFRYTGNRNQMPLYLYLQALFFEPQNERPETFATGKSINITLSILLLAALFLILKKHLALFETALLVLITAFSAFIFKAAYFTSENLYYFLSFLGFVLLCRMLLKPNLRLALVTGLVLGLGHLTKASIIPGLLIFLVVFAAKLIAEKCVDWKEKTIPTFGLLVVFMVTLLPYGLESKREYGGFFYNVNYIVMWYDSWDEAVAQADHSGGDPAWHQIPSVETPGPMKYLREHSAAQIRDRILYGLQRQIENIRYQFNFFNYPLFYLLVIGLVLTAHAQNGWHLVKQNFFLIGFVGLYLAGYFSSFVWYSAIASLWRFIYGLHLPLMFSLFVSINSVTGRQSTHLTRLISITAAALLIIDIWYVLEIGLFVRNFAS